MSIETVQELLFVVLSTIQLRCIMKDEIKTINGEKVRIGLLISLYDTYMVELQMGTEQAKAYYCLHGICARGGHAYEYV